MRRRWEVLLLPGTLVNFQPSKGEESGLRNLGNGEKISAGQEAMVSETFVYVIFCLKGERK